MFNEDKIIRRRGSEELGEEKFAIDFVRSRNKKGGKGEKGRKGEEGELKDKNLPLQEELAEAVSIAEEEKKEKNEESTEKVLSIEEKIGKEKYEALDNFVMSAWEKFITELPKNIPKRIWVKVWEEEASTHIKERVFAFLREQTALEPSEYGVVYDSLVQKVIQKISEKK